MFAISAYGRPADMHRSAVRHRCLTISIVYTRNVRLPRSRRNALCTWKGGGGILHTGFRSAFVLSIRLTQFFSPSLPKSHVIDCRPLMPAFAQQMNANQARAHCGSARGPELQHTGAENFHTVKRRVRTRTTQIFIHSNEHPLL